MQATEAPFPPKQAPKPIGPPWLRRLASLVSYLFHPIFMPALMCLVIWRIQPAEFAGLSRNTLLLRFVTLLMLTIFFPLLVTLLGKALGFVQSIQMRVSRDRVIPLIATMTFYFWLQQVFSHLPDVPKIIDILVLGSFWGIILLFICSIFFKVSMHTSAAGGAIGLMTALLFLSPFNVLSAFFITIIIGGMVGTARLILREHTPFELWAGYVIGLAVQLGAWWYVG
ncbi:MAG: hypothetical protein JST06_07970 [Bacteroidetes bacterium]|nr:hypothetical protein [Bacteroidota bacterium]MBS1630709.1 hypothetical protein [Bacteroidota bacterium]